MIGLAIQWAKKVDLSERSKEAGRLKLHNVDTAPRRFTPTA
jgi:hypothetical protein